MPRILLVAPSPAGFIELDRELLSQRYDVEKLYSPRPQLNVFALWRAVRRADVVLGWWAHVHTVLPFALAALTRTPTVLIVGGFDTASLPEIDYGNQRPGREHLWRRLVSRFVMRRARVLATNSNYSVDELERNAGIPPERVTVLHHGVPDPFGRDPEPAPQRSAVTIGLVAPGNLERKGLSAFVLAAKELPDVTFTVIGPWVDGAEGELRALAGPNVELTGFLSRQELGARLRSAAAYVQASRHEGFGVSVAEAMLAGAIPVVTQAGALPEVVGDVGIVVSDTSPATLAKGVEEALAATPDQRRAAREHVLSAFPVQARREGLEALVERALGHDPVLTSAASPARP